MKEKNKKIKNLQDSLPIYSSKFCDVVCILKFRTPISLHIHIKGNNVSKICWLNYNIKTYYKAHKWRKTFKLKITR